MRLRPDVEPLLESLIERVGKAWSDAVALPLVIQASASALVDRGGFLRSLGRSVCCGRSLFLGGRSGIGGWILPEAAADRMARGLLRLPAPPPHSLASLGGPVDQGMAMLHELFLGAWNRGAPPSLRLSEEIGERAVERVPGGVLAEVTESIYPWVLVAALDIDGLATQVGILVSPEMVESPAPGFVPAKEIVSWLGSGRAPVAFIDPSGELVRWLHDAVRTGKIECVREGASAPRGAATLVVGGSPGMTPIDTITIRAK